MKKRNNLAIYVLGIICLLLFIAFISVELYVWITYTDVPVSELPIWVIIFMFGRR